MKISLSGAECMQKRDKCAWKNEMWLLGYIGFSSDILDLHWIYWLFIGYFGFILDILALHWDILDLHGIGCQSL